MFAITPQQREDARALLEFLNQITDSLQDRYLGLRRIRHQNRVPVGQEAEFDRSLQWHGRALASSRRQAGEFARQLHFGKFLSHQVGRLLPSRLQTSWERHQVTVSLLALLVLVQIVLFIVMPSGGDATKAFMKAVP